MTALFAWLGNTINDFWLNLRNGMWIIYLAIVAWLTFAWKGVEIVVNMLIGLISKLDGIVGYLSAQHSPAAPGGGDIYWMLATANTFFPLDELMHMAAAYVTFCLVPVALYRLAKAYLPLMAT